MGKKKKRRKVQRLMVESLERHIQNIEDRPVFKPFQVHPSNDGKYSEQAKQMYLESLVWAEEARDRELKAARKRLKRYLKTGTFKVHKKHKKDRKRK